MNNNIIELSDLSFSYGENQIFNKSNLSIKKNSFSLICGPNGAGKTTLLKLMMGLLKADCGTININQEDIGYVPQALNFDKEFPISVFEFVLLGALDKLSWLGRYSKKDKREADKLIHKMGLCHKKYKPIYTLSLGQLQRLLIANALLKQPSILLLDEPTASLDKESATQIFQQLIEIKKNTTILLITHQPPEDLSAIDRVIYIHKEIQDLDAEEICRHYPLGLSHGKGGVDHD